MTVTQPTFTLGELFADASASVRRRPLAHLAFSGIGVLGVACVLGGFLAIWRAGTRPLAHAFDPVLVLVGVLLVSTILPLLALHNGLCAALHMSDVRGETLSFAAIVLRAVKRLPTNGALLLTRLGLDALAACIASTFAFAVARVVVRPSMGDAGIPVMIASVVIAYGLIGAFVLATRAFVGLAIPIAEAEACGAIRALGRSATLLAGHRLRFTAVRVVWSLAAAAVLVPLYLLGSGLGWASSVSGHSELVIAAIVVGVVVQYTAVFFAYGVDTLLECACYSRLVPRSRVDESMASVFD